MPVISDVIPIRVFRKVSCPLCQDQVASNLDLEFVQKLCSTRNIKTIMTDLESFSTKEEEDNKHKEAGVHTEIGLFEELLLMSFSILNMLPGEVVFVVPDTDTTLGLDLFCHHLPISLFLLFLLLVIF